MGNNNGLVLLLLGIGALYLVGRGGAAAPPSVGAPSVYYPSYTFPITMPSQAPMTTLYMEGVTSGPARPEAENRLLLRKVNGKTYHVGYTKAEEAWRRAQPARTIGRGGGLKAR